MYFRLLLLICVCVHYNASVRVGVRGANLSTGGNGVVGADIDSVAIDGNSMVGQQQGGKEVDHNSMGGQQGKEGLKESVVSNGKLGTNTNSNNRKLVTPRETKSSILRKKLSNAVKKATTAATTAATKNHHNNHAPNRPFQSTNQVTVTSLNKNQHSEEDKREKLTLHDPIILKREEQERLMNQGQKESSNLPSPESVWREVDSPTALKRYNQATSTFNNN